MPLQIETTEGPVVISDHQIQGVVRHAERRADLTAAALEATGLFPKKPAFLPGPFLLELGAVLELGMWERQGLLPHLHSDLPTFREAAGELAARAKQGPAAFEGSEAAPFSGRVLRVWMEQLAWEGPDHFQADVVVGRVDEDQFADLLADFVWQHRDELGRFLTEHPPAQKREGP